MTLWNQNPSALHLCHCQAACHHLYSTFNPLMKQSCQKLSWQDPQSHVHWMYFQHHCWKNPSLLSFRSSVTLSTSRWQQVYFLHLSKNSRRYTSDKENITWPGCAEKLPFCLQLTYTGKLIEKVVLWRLNKHMSDHNLGESFQSAYRPNHSTETALMRVQHDITKELDQDRGVALVLLELSAAFDTINTRGVIDTLHQQIGVTGVPLKWFKSYLSKRSQRIRIGSTTSRPATLSRGVSQGSVLGPVSVTSYTIPISSICKRHGVYYHIYADDTQLYVSFDPTIPGDRERALARLKSCIAEIRAWMLTHELKLNDNKTEFNIFQSRHHNQKYGTCHLDLGEFVFQPSNAVRNLGAFFDANMTMNRHVSEVCRSAFFHIRQIGRIRNFLTRDACSDTVRSAILSRLDYANALFGGLRQTDLDRLQRVQNCAARVISRTKIRERITPILCDLHWLPVPSRIQFKLCVCMYKVIHGAAPDYICSELTLYRPQRALRSSNNGQLLNITVGRKEAFDFIVKGPQLWNDLPIDIRNSPSLTTFKSRLKTFLFRKHYF